MWARRILFTVINCWASCMRMRCSPSTSTAYPWLHHLETREKRLREIVICEHLWLLSWRCFFFLPSFSDLQKWTCSSFNADEHAFSCKAITCKENVCNSIDIFMSIFSLFLLFVLLIYPFQAIMRRRGRYFIPYFHSTKEKCRCKMPLQNDAKSRMCIRLDLIACCRDLKFLVCNLLMNTILLLHWYSPPISSINWKEHRDSYFT